MNTKDCKLINSLFIDFIDKNLDEEHTTMVKEHLNRCASCRNELENLAEVLTGIERMEDVEPPAEVRRNFLTMLEEEKANIRGGQQKARKIWLYNPFSQVAAGLVILLAGAFLGMMLNLRPSSGTQEIAQLRSDLEQTKQMLFMAKLDQNSASQRIQAVNYTQGFSQPDDNVLKALAETMNSDENVNVRMAAMHALTRFSNNDFVRDALVNSLSIQKDPLLQITLINILVTIRENKAKEPMQELLKKEETIEAVKQMAEKGLTSFI